MSLSSSVINFFLNFLARLISLSVFPDSIRILFSTLLLMLFPLVVDIARNHQFDSASEGGEIPSSHENLSRVASYDVNCGETGLNKRKPLKFVTITELDHT